MSYAVKSDFLRKCFLQKEWIKVLKDEIVLWIL